MKNIPELLKENPLFQFLSDDDIHSLTRGCQLHSYQPGEHVFFQNDNANFFYLIAEGRIKLYRTTSEGDEKVVEVFRSGQTFAEAIMFMQKQAYPVNAQCLEKCTLIVIDNQSYRRVLENNTKACFSLLGDLSMRLHMRLNEIETLSIHTGTFRVLNYFLNQIPESAHDGHELDLGVTKQLLASRLAIKPETLSRILQKLQDQNLISVNGKLISFPNVKALREAHAKTV